MAIGHCVLKRCSIFKQVPADFETLEASHGGLAPETRLLE